MDWPVPFPAELRAGTVLVRGYETADAAELLGALADERVWEHMSRGGPGDAAEMDEVIRSKLGDGNRVTFTIRQGERAVGITSVLFDPHDPAGVEVGGTLLDPEVWGTGVNTDVKRLLLAPGGSSCAPTSGTAGRPPRFVSSARPTWAPTPSSWYAGTAPAGGAGFSASTGTHGVEG
jgi:hypothetical protein